MTEQRTEQWLSTASRADVAAAYDAGELRDLLTTPPTLPVPKPRPEGQLANVAGFTPAEVTDALAAGKLTHLLGG